MSATPIAEAIEKLERDVERLKKEMAQSLGHANRERTPASWEAVAESRGEMIGVRLALSYLREL